MLRCRVIGSTVATIRAPGLRDLTLLVVRPEAGADRESVAVDTVGAGAGDVVLVTFGSGARDAVHGRTVPTDAAIVAIVDEPAAG